MALPRIDVPRYPVTIPSTGEEYIMRPYLVKEEKILLLAMESGDPKQIALAIRNLITNCIEGDVDIDTLAGFDIEKLFLELRGISVGEKIQLQTKCQNEECEHPNGVEIDIKDVTLKDYNPEDSIIRLSGSVGVTMKYPTLEILGEMDPEKLESIETLMEIIISCINTIFDDENVYDCKKENIKEVRDFIDNLTSDQFQKISNFFQNTPVLEYDLKFVCEKCEHESSYELRGLQSFFYVGLSHESIINYYQTNFALVQHHKYSLTELENMIPWEREVYVGMLKTHIEEELEKQQRNK